MKLWDGLTTCMILLSAVQASPLHRSRRAEGLRDFPPVRISVSLGSKTRTRSETEEVYNTEQQSQSMGELHPDQFEDVVDFIKVTISRIRRSSSTSSSSPTSSSTSDLNLRTRHRRERKVGADRSSQVAVKETVRKRKDGSSGGRKGGRGGGRGQGCVLKQIHLNVSDLGLGYQTSEEMIFKYCSGPCRKSETNYDKILNNLTHNRKLLPENTPSQACCRPVEFDDALSFLDDNNIYHTMRKHSARKCGCV